MIHEPCRIHTLRRIQKPRCSGLAIALLLAITTSACAPSSQSASTVPSSAASLGSAPETFAYAAPSDLRLWMVAWKRNPDTGFPVAVVQIRNITEHDVIVAYEPGSLKIHCGDFVQSGPPDTAVLRREILGPLGWINFPPPTAGWVEMDQDGSPDLSVPTQLPSGRYALWATFVLATPDHTPISTGKQDFSADARASPSSTSQPAPAAVSP
jgi:hypothetical protein